MSKPNIVLYRFAVWLQNLSHRIYVWAGQLRERYRRSTQW